MIVLSYTYSEYSYIDLLGFKYTYNKYLLEAEGTGFLSQVLLNLLNMKNAMLILIGLLNFTHFLFG